MNFLSITQAAKLLGKSRNWVWVLVISNRIKSHRIGKIYIIEEKVLREYMDNTKNHNTNEELSNEEQI